MHKYLPNFDRHLIILLIAQAFTGSIIPVLLLITGFRGAELAPDLKLSTLPIALVVVGIALASSVASLTMQKWGRKRGHLLGLAIALVGMAASATGLWCESFFFYCVGNFTCGVAGAFNNQIRFTAAEASGNQKSLVHSWVLMCSLFAALFGPWMVTAGHELIANAEYLGSIALLSSALVLVMLLLCFLPEKAASNVTDLPAVSRGEIFRQPKFWFGAICGITAYSSMTLLMSATPIQMNHVEHFSHHGTASTIQAHIVAMYLPSLFGGVLIAWVGIRRLVWMGIFVLSLSIGTAYVNSGFQHYWWALVLLGVGWNFLFLASSAWVSNSFSGPERFLAQGTNDTLVFGTQSIASLAAGWLLFEVGWKNLVLFPIPLLLMTLVLSVTKVSAVK